MITVFLKSMFGQLKGELSVDPTKKIKDYADEINQKFDNSNGFKVLFGGNVLNQEDTFEKLGIQNEMTLMILPSRAPPVATTNNTASATRTNNTAGATATNNTAGATTAPMQQASTTAQMQQASSLLTSLFTRVFPVQNSTGGAANNNSNSFHFTQYTLPTTPAQTGTSNMWLTPQHQTDSTSPYHLYNIEQIHAAFMMILPIFISDANLTQQVIANPNNSLTLLNNEEDRNKIREALNGADVVVDSLKRGLPINLSMRTLPLNTPTASATTMSEGATATAITVEPTSQETTNVLPANDNTTALFQTMFNALLNSGATTNLNTFDDGEIDEEDEEQEEENPTSTSESNQELSEEDRNNINVIMDFTGCTMEQATQAYMACHRNVRLASERILLRY
jgi:hypothetical protein